MRARFTRSLGLPVIDEQTGGVLGSVAGILLHPDTGIVEGFFVRTGGFLSSADVFLQSADILHWGARVTVRRDDVLGPVEEIVRLRSLLEDGRPVIGQRMVTKGGTLLGTCKDVQFTTRDFRLEWLFPKKWFHWRVPVSASHILEIRRSAIIIRDAAVAEKEDVKDVLPMLAQPEAA